jgi:hypothetical protein
MAGTEGNSGGYRQPTNPAPVSGPGALSERTDGGAIDGMTQPQQQYTGMPYGQNKAVNEQQAGASMAGNPFPFSDLTPLSAPTTRPEEPITHGIDIGPGGGSEVLNYIPNRAPSLVDTIKRLAQYDPSGEAELIYRQLIDQGY